MSRLLLIDKPVGPTSHDMVDRVRRELKIKKAGHCGTLDPLASGLLLVLTGWATRLAEVFSGHEKLYRATVRFGSATDSDDADGRVIAERKDFDLGAADLAAALAELKSRTLQLPPIYSAIKVKGVPLYKLARRGEALPEGVAERPVQLSRLDLLERREQELDLEVLCSAGTYVRALARDLGDMLGIPAHLSALRRLRSGPFAVDAALAPADLKGGQPEAPLGLDLEAALFDLPAVELSAAYLERLRHGAQPGPEDLAANSSLPPAQSWVRLLDPAGRLLALGRMEEGGLRLRRRIVTEGA